MSLGIGLGLGLSQSRGFNLSSLSGLLAWFHADDAVASGADLTAWAPRAGTAAGQAAAGISASAPQVVTRAVNGWQTVQVVQTIAANSTYVYWDSVIGAAAAGTDTPLIVIAELELVDAAATGTILGWTTAPNSNNDRLTFGTVVGRSRVLRRKTVTSDEDDFSPHELPVGQRFGLIYEYNGASLRETLRGHGGGRNLHPSSTAGAINCTRLGFGMSVDGTPDGALSMHMRQFAIVQPSAFLPEATRKTIVELLGDTRPYASLNFSGGYPTLLIVRGGQSNQVGVDAPGTPYTPNAAVPCRVHTARNATRDWSPHDINPSTIIGENTTTYGPDVGMVEQLTADGFATPYAIAKHAHGGTGLATDWTGSGDDAIDLPIFLTESRNTDLYPFMGSISERWLSWIQGENDTIVEADSLAYAANYETLEDAYESALGATLDKVVIVRLHKDNASGTYTDNVRAQQEAIILADPAKRLLVVPDHLTLTTNHYHDPDIRLLGNLEARAFTDDSWCTLRGDALVVTSPSFAWHAYRGYNNVLANAVAGTAAPTVSAADADFNDLNVLSFNGTDSGVRLDEAADALESSGIVTVAMRLRLDALATGKALLSFTVAGSNTLSANLQLSGGGGTGNIVFRVQDDTSVVSPSLSWVPDTTSAHTLIITYDKANKQITSFRVDGTEKLGAPVSVDPGGAITVDQCSLGYRATSTPGAYTDMRLAEVRVYNEDRTVAQKQRDESEFSAVWV